jgi:glucose/mannose-6-phosphate isomerase
MEKLVINFPNQLQEAFDIADNARVTAPTAPIHHILLAGLGGSGIGGNMVAELIREECKVPFLITKGYEMPAFVGKNTLVILSSYSGNTEETLSIFEQAFAAGAKIIAITSGGKLAALAQQHNLDMITVPGGMPPRSCLGYSLVQQVAALTMYGFVSDRVMTDLKAAHRLLVAEQAEIRTKASRIAQFLHHKLAVIYTTDRMESVAVRFRQQINENSKVLCWHHVIPEMNHNELVGWRTKDDNLAVVLFRNEDDNDRNQQRIELNKEVFNEYTNTIIEIWSKGATLAERALYFVHLGDFISTDLAALRGVDAVEVKVIDHLKNSLT